MRLTNASEQPTVRGSEISFTGVAWQQTLAISDTSQPLHVARVTFEPGTRTVWHRHPLGQILVATSGIGRFQSEMGAVTELYPGDSVTFAPGETHWHGASPDQLFVHTSIQAEDAKGNQAIWLDPVTEIEYRAEPSPRGERS